MGYKAFSGVYLFNCHLLVIKNRKVYIMVGLNTVKIRFFGGYS